MLSENPRNCKDLPSYTDFPEPLFVSRMDGFGLRRSQTQKITPGDGDCLFHSVLDGYNNLHPGGSMFERKADNTEDTVFARKMVVHSLKMELQKQYSRGCMDLAYQMACLEDASPDTYLNKMKRVGEFADHLVLQMLASILQHDIITVNVHPDTSLPYQPLGCLVENLVPERVLEDRQSMWHFMKRGNSLMAIIKLLSPVLTLPQHFQS